ncbi:MAG: bifunctional glutamate N-acetyltransferase/amino-acid acetyltransferase ArgJ [Nitrospinota bacterium]
MSPGETSTRRPASGGVTAPQGFLASAVRAGIKREGLDLALLFSEREASAAGIFTCNAMAAPPVLLCRERVLSGKARAVVMNSGNANACTGEEGERDALAMTRRTAQALGLPDDGQVLAASTGIIGHPLPMGKIQNAIPAAVAALDAKGGEEAARAILTTDTVPKLTVLELDLSGGRVCVGGMAKGAGMIRPRLVSPEKLPPHATMLGFLTTDARVEAAALQAMLEEAAEGTFNSITVDGETSTNDMVLLLANGASGVGVSSPEDRNALRGAIEEVCRVLAHAIVRDGEGATKFITVRVSGAADNLQARRAAFAVADSNLVKTALFGNDANWGRIVSAAGACGAAMRPEAVRAALNGVETFGGGHANPKGGEALAEGLKGREVQIDIDMGVADGAATVWTCDLSYEYVRINAEYHT